MKYKIFNKSKEFTQTENNIIQCINNDPHTFLFKSMTDYGKHISCSKSSIGRIVEILNFCSYLDMKLYVQKQVIKTNFYFNIDKNNKTLHRLNNLKSYNNYSINETIANLNIKKFKSLCDSIYDSKRILVFGISGSWLAAYELCKNLSKIGLNVFATQNIHDAILNLSSFNKADSIIIFSKSGNTIEIGFILDLALKMMINTVIITANKELAKKAKHCIILEDSPKENRIIPTSSKISQIIIADAIYYEIYYKNPTQNKKIIDETFSVLDSWKKDKFF